MPYPPRTRASDAIARNLYQDLAGTANGGKNRCMVSVVVIGDVDIPRAAFIATSGSAGLFGGLRTAVQNLRGHGVYGGVDYTLVGYTQRNNLIHPQHSSLPALPGMGLFLENPRDCAEPKALEAAAATGSAISGMSTFWWGNVANGYPDPDVDTTPANVPWALPCAVCQANADNIMRNVESFRLLNRAGVPRRSAEA